MNATKAMWQLTATTTNKQKQTKKSCSLKRKTSCIVAINFGKRFQLYPEIFKMSGRRSTAQTGTTCWISPARRCQSAPQPKKCSRPTFLCLRPRVSQLGLHSGSLLSPLCAQSDAPPTVLSGPLHRHTIRTP